MSKNKKRLKDKKDGKGKGIYCCPSCGSTSFIEEGFGSFSVSVSLSDSSTITDSGDYHIEPLSSTIKCAQCGTEANN